MSSDRELILGRIRAALADVPSGEPALWSIGSDGDDPSARYARRQDASPRALLELFAERCADYRATVTRCGTDADDLEAAVAAICARQRATRLIAPVDLDVGRTPPQISLDRDDGSLAAPELARYDGALTACALAIAETGTIVLDAAPAQGRRLLSLVTDLHICVVRADQVLASVPEAVTQMAASARAGRPLTLISGPSATSDIELVRVEGVHGPRRLEVILVGGPADPAGG